MLVYKCSILYLFNFKLDQSSIIKNLKLLYILSSFVYILEVIFGLKYTQHLLKMYTTFAQNLREFHSMFISFIYLSGHEAFVCVCWGRDVCIFRTLGLMKETNSRSIEMYPSHRYGLGQ